MSASDSVEPARGWPVDSRTLLPSRPMFTRDYLLRQIHQLIKALERVLFLKSNQQEIEALQEIDLAFSGQNDLEPLLRDGMTREEVLALVHARPAVSAEFAASVADLLWERIWLEPEDSAQDFPARYALWLYEYALTSEGAVLPLDAYDRIAWLRRFTSGGEDAEPPK